MSKQNSNEQPDKSATASEDPFSAANIQRLRMSQDFGSMAGVRPAITSIAVRKPHRHEFVRVRGGSEWRFETRCFIEKESKEVYLVSPPLWPAMSGDVRPTCLVAAMTRNSPVPFLWPLKVSDAERPNRWNESAIEAARLAEDSWLRAASDSSTGQYVPHIATAKIPEPEWPEDLVMVDYLKLAFKDRFIQDNDHTILRRLRGEI